MDEGSSKNGECYDLSSLLSSEGRDFLVRNNGDQVKIKDLRGKIVGLYFSASWCPPCRGFTPALIEVYNEISSKGDFEIVFISSDRDEDSFKGYLSKMPWLAIPFSDSLAIKALKGKFNVKGIPHLVLLNKYGEVSTTEGVALIKEHQTAAYPFTPEKIRELKESEEDAKRNQSLKSLLVCGSRDYVVSNDQRKIRVADLEGKIVGLYFCTGSYTPCTEFTHKLAEVYNKLKENGENFEVVSIYVEENKEDTYKEAMARMPWFALPFKDKLIAKLARYFKLRTIPRLVILGTDGKTLSLDVAELIDEHGVGAYPFTPQRLAELSEINRAKIESQTLEDILVSGDKDYVVDQSGSKVPVSELVGKHVLIYFSAHWCPPCRSFTPRLIEAYREIKAKENAIEVIFVSSDREQRSFEEYYSSMPWLALPFGDPRKASLSRRFKVKGIPYLVAIGPKGKTVSTRTRDLIAAYGADSFPFTDDHIRDLRGRLEEGPKG